MRRGTHVGAGEAAFAVTETRLVALYLVGEQSVEVAVAVDVAQCHVVRPPGGVEVVTAEPARTVAEANPVHGVLAVGKHDVGVAVVVDISDVHAPRGVGATAHPAAHESSGPVAQTCEVLHPDSAQDQVDGTVAIQVAPRHCPRIGPHVLTGESAGAVPQTESAGRRVRRGEDGVELAR